MFNEVNGFINFIKLKLVEVGVFEIENNVIGIVEMIVVNRYGIKIIGFLNKFGIIIFIVFNVMVKVIFGLLIF